MNKFKFFKRISVLGITILLISVFSLSVFAASQSGSSLGHANDQWNYGPTPGLLPWDWNKTGQYSDFYCANTNHSATARIVQNGSLVESKQIKPAGQWAKASTGIYTNVTEWRSYYSHL